MLADFSTYAVNWNRRSKQQSTVCWLLVVQSLVRLYVLKMKRSPLMKYLKKIIALKYKKPTSTMWRIQSNVWRSGQTLPTVTVSFEENEWLALMKHKFSIVLSANYQMNKLVPHWGLSITWHLWYSKPRHYSLCSVFIWWRNLPLKHQPYAILYKSVKSKKPIQGWAEIIPTFDRSGFRKIVLTQS